MKTISINELKQKNGTEGLVLQGCGGDIQEWIDGINGMLTEEGILRDGSVFTDVTAFENEGRTNLLFSMDGVNLDIGKLAMWRLRTHSDFGGTWLSNYLPNKFGVDWSEVEPEEVQAKPDCPIIDADGNIFSLMGIASRTLKRSGLADEAKEMTERVTSSGSYDEALAIITEYVNPVSHEEYEQGHGMQMGGME